MKSSGLTDEEKRKYFEDGVDEFRYLLEREFRRSHPSGKLNLYPVGPLPKKVYVDVTLAPIKSQAYAENRTVPREVEQVGSRGARRTVASAGSTGGRYRRHSP
jgi:hypothetical protein